MMDMTGNSLTSPSDWDSYYASRKSGGNPPSYIREVIAHELLSDKPGDVFELGCGDSIVLRMCAHTGWRVSGIDFNRGAVDDLSSFLNSENLPFRNLICDDVHRFDCSPLRGTFDTLVSIGFLEHFKHPELILSRWAHILKNGGKVISVVPNLFNVNAQLLKKISPQHWDQHRLISPGELDGMHLQAGLEVVSMARFKGGFDMDMYVPWDVIRHRLKFPVLHALARKSVELLLMKAMNQAFQWNRRFISPIMYGVYRKR